MDYVKLSLSIWCVFLIIAYSSVSTNKIVRPKSELKNELKELFDNGGALSDFVFLELEDLKNYTDVKGTPRNRTEVRRSSRPKAKQRDDVEKTLAKARKDYGSTVDTRSIITDWALVLHSILYNSNVANGKKLQLLKGVKKLAAVSIFAREKTKSTTAQDNAEEQVDEETKTEDLESIETVLASIKDELEKDKEALVRKRRAIDLPYHPRRAVQNVRKSPVQTMDYQRMRRSLSYDYYGSGSCYDEGSQGTISDTVLLCTTCYKTVDFGSSVIPQYANSIECDDSAPNCLYEDGTCTQKVVYYTFQKLVDAVSDTWNTFEQPLNVSCECECIAGSTTATYMVGNSNENNEI